MKQQIEKIKALKNIKDFVCFFLPYDRWMRQIIVTRFFFSEKILFCLNQRPTHARVSNLSGEFVIFLVLVC